MANKPDGDLLDLLAAGRLFRRILQTSALDDLKDMLQTRRIGQDDLEIWDSLHNSLSEVGRLIKMVSILTYFDDLCHTPHLSRLPNVFRRMTCTRMIRYAH